MTIEELIELLRAKWNTADDSQKEALIKSVIKGAATKPFLPPTPEQVIGYAVEHKIKIDANDFCDFYDSKGWMVGKNRMKDWKAAARRWARTNHWYSKPVRKPPVVQQQATTSTSDNEEMY